MYARNCLFKKPLLSTNHTSSRPLINKNFGLQHAEHLAQSSLPVSESSSTDTKPDVLVLAPPSPIKSVLFAISPRSIVTSNLHRKTNIFMSSYWRHESSTKTLSTFGPASLLENFNWRSDGPRWCRNIDGIEFPKSAAALRFFNGIFVRLRRLVTRFPLRLPLYGMKLAIRADNLTAVKVYLNEVLMITQSGSLSLEDWFYLVEQGCQGLTRVRSQTSESWHGSISKRRWVDMLTGIGLDAPSHATRSSKANLYAAFNKRSSAAWEGYIRLLRSFQDSDLLHREWIKFMLDDAHNFRCGLDRPNVSSLKSQTRTKSKSSITLERSSGCLANQTPERDTDQLKPPFRSRTPSDDDEQRSELKNMIMNYFFRAFVSLSDFDRAWEIAHQDPLVFGDLKAKSWTQLFLQTHSFTNWTPNVSLSIMESLEIAEKKSWDDPVPQELVSAMERLEADLGLQWMGDVKDHVMSNKHVAGHVSGFDDEEDNSSAQKAVADMEQLRDLWNERQTATSVSPRPGRRLQPALKRRQVRKPSVSNATLRPSTRFRLDVAHERVKSRATLAIPRHIDLTSLSS